jgi:hypothetical protein
MSVDSLNDEHLPFKLDLASNLAGELVIAGVDLTRLQRASERTAQSTARGRHDVVERGRARRVSVWRDLVVSCHLGVNSEHDWFVLGRQVGEPYRTLLALDSDARSVDHISGL